LIALLAMPAFASKSAKGNQLASVRPQLNQQVDVEVQPRLAQPEYPVTVPNRSMEKAGKAGLSGLYSIGTLVPGGYVANYLTLANAVAALQANGVAGAVTFEFTDAAYVDTGVTIGGYAGQNDYTVTFQPATGVSPTLTFTAPAIAYPLVSGGSTANIYAIQFLNAKNIVFQGTTTPWSFGFTTRPMTMVIDTAAVIGTYILRKDVILFNVNNENILMKDINMIGWRKWSGTLGPYGIVYGVNSTAGRQKNLTFQNILTKRGSYGFNFGPAAGYFDTSITIQGCQIGTDRYEPLQYGVGASNQRNFYLLNNDITGVYSQGIAPVTTSPRGINMAWGGMFGTRIWGNKIHGIQADVINGVCYGIQIHSNGAGGSVASDDWRIFNNFIYDINYMGVRTGGNYQTSEGLYMYDYGAAPAVIGNVRFYNNTVHLFGTQTPAAAGGWTGCVAASDLTGDYFRWLYNIFANGRVSSGGGQAYFDAFENNPAYLIDNNVYYGYNGNSTCASGDLAALRSWTLQDFASVEGNPGFISDQNPHIDKTTVGFVSIANALALPYVQIPVDIDNEARDGVTPDAGADEFTPTPWPIDAKPMEIYLPLAGGYPLGGIPKAGFTPSVKVRNNGATDVTIKVRLIISGGEYASTEEVFVPTLSNADVNFTTPWTPATIGAKDVMLVTEVYADNDMTNDTLRSTTRVVKLASVPYCTNFEDGEEAYFFGTGFTLGTPSKANITSTFNGANAWVVNPLAANYVDNFVAYLYTPYFDFTGLYNPKISFEHMFGIEATWDEGVVEYTDDYGATWNLLGTYLENPSWYNDNTIADLIFGEPGFSGYNTSFPTSYDLAYLYASQVSNKVVQFRFHFASDGATNDEGWVIDQFCINKAATISGVLYNDADNSGGKGGSEPGISGKKVYYGTQYVTTAGDGSYTIPGLTPGTYSLTTEAITGTRTQPVTYPYSVPVVDNDAITGKDFGYYWPGVISGVVYYDENHNGTKDGGEVGMDGITVKIDGPANYTVVTAGGGLFSKNVDVVGTYDVTQDLTTLPSGYIQYMPVSNGGYNVVVAYGGTYANNDFANTASKSARLFRTVMYEDWAAAQTTKPELAKQNKKKNDKCEIEFIVTAAFDCDQVLIKKFGGKFTGTVQIGTGSAVPLADVTGYDIVAPVAVGTQIHVKGHLTNKTKATYGVEIHWDGVTAPLWKQKLKVAGDYIVNQGRLPMPNWHNVTEALNVGGYFGKTNPLWVGVQQGGTNPAAVYHADYKKVIESMVIAKSTSYHTGDPVCMSMFTKAQKSYKPTLSPSNKFFAELLTLKLNMMASTAGYFPNGLKELTFDDPNDLANPFNGLKVEAIAGKAESLLTCLTLESGATIEEAYATIRMIDSAFNHSPIDTTAWGSLAWPGIEVKGVRPLSEVEYLFADPSYNPQKGLPTGPAVTAPVEYALEQNYPNPFNPSTTIEFTLLQPGNVTLKVYNMLGQEVASLLDNVYYDEGYNDVDFDASGLSSGIYFYRLTVQNVDDQGTGVGRAFTQIKKMMLVK